MTPGEILKTLSFSTDFPHEAIAAARARKQEMIPLLLALIEDFTASGGRAAVNGDGLFMAFHLLGEWGEPSAYRPLCRLLCLPDECLEPALGDAITETSDRVMAAVCDGDPQPLYNLILNEKADVFVRWAMCDALAVAVFNGRLEKESVAQFLRGAFEKLRPRKNNITWAGWLDAVAMLGLDDFRPLAKKVFADGMIPPEIMDISMFESDLDWTLANPGKMNPDREERYKLFGDVTEVAHFYAPEGIREEETADILYSETVINPHRHVGRNDFCPCGSGRKFKKCCLRQAV